MELQQWAYLADIAGVVVVAVTLIYLARQVSQGNVLTRMQSRETLMNQDLLTLQLQLADRDISRTFYKETLDEDEWLKLHLFLTVFLRQREWEWLLHKDGVFPKEIYETYAEVIPIFFGTERTRKWWTALGKAAIAPQLAAEIDAMLAKRPMTDYWTGFLEFVRAEATRDLDRAAKTVEGSA
jgi:hypothetical protein